QCAATYVAIVAILPVVNIDLGPDTTLCSGQVLVLDAGTSGLNYTWNTGATTQTIQATTSGTYSVSASNGACAGQDAISLTFDPSPTDPLQDTIACAGGTITLDAGNPGCTWLWNTGATTPTIDVVSSGTYSVTVTNAMNCSGHFDAEVTFADPPVVDLGPDTVLCEGDVLTLDAGNPGATYQWSNGQDTRTINVTSGGIYSVVVNNGLCTGTDGISTTFNQRPDRLGTHQFFTCLDKEPHYVVISAGNNGSSYEWSTGASSQVILAGAYGWYYVDITNSLDCSVRDSAVVTEFCDPSLYVPNSFTPNGDGVNDIWHADGNNIGYFNLNVFDRGGQVIFHSENFTYGWDGKIDGEDAPPGVYVWRMEYRFVKDTEGKEGMIHSQLGHVTLLR
ncbi:MAG TPA: gliding motility-associated C-terminal domain-containing protein, partial [Flavobacteriales bacterium]|nr:gliding motility-associated C-terminal domain-containing protein [Flavobacteriales bacterium]